MSQAAKTITTASCTCGHVAFEATGAPIACAACYCDDCQGAARELQALPNAPAIADPDGGTPMVVFRKDRVKCVKGGELLQAHKFKSDSPTNRTVATCCNSAMTLTFDDSKWWADIYLGRIHGEPPAVEMRSCTKFRRSDEPFPDNAPRFAWYPPRLFARLVAARIAMLLGR